MKHGTFSPGPPRVRAFSFNVFLLPIRVGEIISGGSLILGEAGCELEDDSLVLRL